MNMRNLSLRRHSSSIQGACAPRFRSDVCLNPILWRQRTPRPSLVVSRAYFPDRDTIDEESMSILDRHRQLFAKFATPDNVLTRDGLSAIMQSVGSEVVPLNWLTDEDIDGAMEAYDLNRDGMISQEEFEQMANDNVFLLRSLGEYRQIFDSLNTGKNNLIGPTEMYRYFEDQKCGDGVGSFERVERLVRRYDLNNDGSIDFSEFLRLCRNEDVLPLEEILCYVKAGAGKNDCENLGNSGKGKGSKSTPTLSLDRSKVHVLKSPEEFSDIMSSVSDTTVVVLFASLTWCRPCKKVQPQLEKMAAAYGEACDVVFLKIYGNESDALKSFFKEQLKVRVTPSFFFFTGGKLVESTTGATVTKHETQLRVMLGSRAADVRMLYP